VQRTRGPLLWFAAASPLLFCQRNVVLSKRVPENSVPTSCLCRPTRGIVAGAVSAAPGSATDHVRNIGVSFRGGAALFQPSWSAPAPLPLPFSHMRDGVLLCALLRVWRSGHFPPRACALVSVRGIRRLVCRYMHRICSLACTRTPWNGVGVLIPHAGTIACRRIW
jgi:hypothetical protein